MGMPACDPSTRKFTGTFLDETKLTRVTMALRSIYDGHTLAWYPSCRPRHVTPAA